MDKIGVLLIDDHAILRYGLKMFLSSAEDITITGEASSGEECLGLCKKTEPDVCLLDIELPKMDGIETAGRVKERYPSVKVIIFSMYLKRNRLKEALATGVEGYLTKTASKQNILESIRSVAGGNNVYSDAVSEMMTETIFKNGGCKKESPGENLTKRENEVLELVVNGHSSAQIADKLFISPRTVEKHRSNVMKKFDVCNTAALVRRAVNLGVG